MSTALRNFIPEGTVILAVTASTGRVELSGFPLNRKDVMLYNAGTVAVFIEFGGDSVTAAVTDMPIPPGAWGVLHSASHTHIAAIAASGTANLHITSGFGN